MKSEADASPWPVAILARVCLSICNISLVTLIAMVALEVILRRGLGVSLGFVDELGGYFLVTITFLSLAPCQRKNAFHRVELFVGGLSHSNRAILNILFNILSLAVSLIVLWHLFRLVSISWRTQETSYTALLTPLWIPRLAMPLGMAALCMMLAQIIFEDTRRLICRKARGSE